MKKEFIFAGFGGQGVQTCGKLLIYSANEEDQIATFYSQYGGAMRGGAFHSDSTMGPRSGARIGSGGYKDQQSVGWSQAKVVTGNDAALKNSGGGYRLWAPCKAVK